MEMDVLMFSIFLSLGWINFTHCSSLLWTLEVVGTPARIWS
ncbi:hypothetical protein GBAR_LOCUS12646 [Geodia barretti]|uniref:Uncharacterized protein n=1 Tax=Geodia barretti TaxID=519541 RepID=A0AA35S0Z7_GEOBA|nr:hypothetical protein GBAR_LOCUS12646 [Geodia barretti]